MANPTFSSPINLQLPQVASGVSDDMQPIVQGIYNAIRQLQGALGDLTGASSDSISYVLSLDQKASQSIQIQKMQYLALPASVAISAGQMVNIFDSGSGVLKYRLANASAIGTRAYGWCAKSALLGASCVAFLFDGYNANVVGATPAATYYLSDSTPGGISTAKPVGSGKIVQEVALALSTTELLMHLATPIVNP